MQLFIYGGTGVGGGGGGWPTTGPPGMALMAAISNAESADEVFRIVENENRRLKGLKPLKVIGSESEDINSWGGGSITINIDGKEVASTIDPHNGDNANTEFNTRS